MIRRGLSATRVALVLVLSAGHAAADEVRIAVATNFAATSDAKKLVKLVEGGDTLFILTHNYTDYPMVRRGDLGDIRVVQAEHAQDWLAEPLEQTGQKQAAWRTDPEQSGAGGREHVIAALRASRSTSATFDVGSGARSWSCAGERH